MSQMKVGPEGITVGNVFLDDSGARWHFTGFNDVAGEAFALDRNGWPVLASELIAQHEWRHRRPAHPLTPVEVRPWTEMGGVIGTAQGWPDGPGGWADMFEVYAINPGLRRAWLAYTGRHHEGTGRDEYRPGYWKPRHLIVMHAAHIGALARLTLWFERHQQAMYRHRDEEGRAL
ncbi:hypothetical protein ACIRPQ_29305 [Streptomyces sp. NPDC101213]|uniref:hypothetical protein n=1 Tax=Streptomyces sp. NPDC101213 TaxID=3366130 RepID=UPI003823AF3E